jgi:hypothetical protein
MSKVVSIPELMLRINMVQEINYSVQYSRDLCDILQNQIKTIQLMLLKIHINEMQAAIPSDIYFDLYQCLNKVKDFFLKLTCISSFSTSVKNESRQLQFEESNNNLKRSIQCVKSAYNIFMVDNVSLGKPVPPEENWKEKKERLEIESFNKEIELQRMKQDRNRIFHQSSSYMMLTGVRV